MLVVAVAVANFDGVLLNRPPDGMLCVGWGGIATYSHHRVSLDFLLAAPGWTAISGHFGEVSSQL